jgi:hypothetical protein
MLPGVGIFGSDSITKVLIQLLNHFEFDVYAVWTNHYDYDPKNKSLVLTVESSRGSPKLITSSIDNVLLNKNVNLIFVCCQPNLHSQISTKALGIGKNVICLFPTCKNMDDIVHIINSSCYYPSLLSSISYGGLRYLPEYRLIKQSLHLVGNVRLCNVIINCQNIAMFRSLEQNDNDRSTAAAYDQLTESANKMSKHSSTENLIDSLAHMASSTASPTSVNWLIDRDLGAGALNRFGAAIISLMLYIFDNRRVTKVYGCLRTFVDEIAASKIDSAYSNKPLVQVDNLNLINTVSNNSEQSSGEFSKSLTSDAAARVANQADETKETRRCLRTISQIRKITADDHCTFQMNLEPDSIMINVTINTLAQCKYSQEINICGNNGVLLLNNSKLTFRTSSHANVNANAASLSGKNMPEDSINCHHHRPQTQKDNNNNNTLNECLDSVEVELGSCESMDPVAEQFLSAYKNFEQTHPEMPYMYIRGLYHYLANVKQEFAGKNKPKSNNDAADNESSISGNSSNNGYKFAKGDSASAASKNSKPPNGKSMASATGLETFEHTRIVQTIVNNINLSSETSRWITVNY